MHIPALRRHRVHRPLGLLIGGILAAASLAMAPVAALAAPDGCVDPGWLGSAAPYTVLGIDGAAVNLHNVSVAGDVAAATGGSLTVMSPSIVNGDVYLGPGVAYQQDGSVTGSVLADQDLSSAVADAAAASSYLASLIPDQTFASWTGPHTIAGNGAVTVVDVGDVNMAGGAITLSGTCFFVINVSGSFDMGGDASIGGVDPSRVYINLTGTTTATTHVGNTFDASWHRTPP